MKFLPAGITLIALLLWNNVASAAELKPIPKATYPQDIVLTGVEPNVLFLLDTGSAMVFTPNGIMPLETDGKSQSARAQALAQATYGVGARPPIINGSSRTDVGHGGHDRYGRDIDDSNNNIGDPYCYYTPDENYPYLLTFKQVTGQDYGKVTNLTSLPFSIPVGNRIINSEHIRNYMVPNDSRMYIMKLVLWRLTEMPQAEMFSKMNVAMATSYGEYNYGTENFYADYYKTSPYGERTGWINGVAPSWSIGVGTDAMGVGQNYRDSQIVYGGINRDNYGFNINAANVTQRRKARQVNRAVLKVPFDKFYSQKSDGTYQPEAHLRTFRQYIDGIEQATGGWNTLNFATFNPELIADGQTPLATSIYGREYHIDEFDSMEFPLIQYGNTVRWFNMGSNTFQVLTPYTTKDGLGAGQAIGSAIDFFSPKVTSDDRGNTNGLAFTETRAGFFPVTGSCQTNWLVIFTAANDESTGAHAAHDAAMKLFKNTLEMRGRIFDKSTNKWKEETYSMNEGVRTIVVGFVSPDATDSNSVQLRSSLNKIAQHGDPIRVGANYVPNPDATAYFANDVPGLIDKLTAVIKRIFGDKMAAGAPVILPMTDTGEENVMLSSSYAINSLDQWKSWFYKYKLTPTGRVELWEAGALMGAKGNNRKLYTTKRKEGITGTVSPTPVKDLGNSDITDLTGAATHMSDFRNWLQTYSDIGPLGDMEHSGMTIVGKPTESSMLTDPLIANRNKTIYIQTNRGVLHAINFETGEETWGFIPPNIFQSRVKRLKYGEAGTWLTGDGKSSMRSEPLDLLDGLMTAHDMKFNQDSQFHTVLLACLGWGGNGLYAMDITKISDDITTPPQFLWALENARYASMDVVSMDNVKRWGEAAQSGGAVDYDYSDLGLTIQAAVPLKLLGDKDVAVLPGGLGYKLGTDSQGKAFYFLDAETGGIFKRIDSGSGTSDFYANGRPLGMGVTPITYINDEQGRTREIYTADSEGNILHCDTDTPVANWKLQGVFQLRTYSESERPNTTAVSADLPVATPLGLLSATTGAGDKWLYGATADIMAPEERKLTNAQQFLFGLCLSKLAGNETTTDLKQWKYMNDGLLPPHPEAIAFDATANLLQASDKGWVLRLRPKMTDANNPRDAEYATTDPFLYDNKLFVATFVPNTRSAEKEETCPELGDAKFYIFNPITGKSFLSDRQAFTLRNVKIAGITAVGNSVWVGIQELGVNATQLAAQDINSNVDGVLATVHGSEGIEIEFPEEDDNPIRITPNIPHIQYWRERVIK